MTDIKWGRHDRWSAFWNLFRILYLLGLNNNWNSFDTLHSLDTLAKRYR